MFFQHMLSQQILSIVCFSAACALILPINIINNPLTSPCCAAYCGLDSYPVRQTELDTSCTCTALVKCEFVHGPSDCSFLRMSYYIQGINI